MLLFPYSPLYMSVSSLPQSSFDKLFLLLVAFFRQKIPLDSSSTTLFYDSSFHCRSFRWFRSLVDKFFIIIIAMFFHIRCCYHLALSFIFSPWPFRLLSSLIFFRQISPSFCCIFSSIFCRCIFLLIARPRQKILLSTMIFYDVSVHCHSFCWLRSLVDKVFVIIFLQFFHRWCCCYLATLFMISICPFLFLSSSIFIW